MLYSLSLGVIVKSGELLQDISSAIAGLPVRVVLEQTELGEPGVFIDKLERVRPQALLLELDIIASQLESIIRQLKASNVAPKIIVVHQSSDSAAILRAVRAGADEFIAPPMTPDLPRAIERMAIELATKASGTRPRGKILGFLSAKGGCGATTLACHIAVELYQQTKLEVLLADFDLEAGVIGFLMKSKSRYSLSDALSNSHRLDVSFWKALVSNGYPGVEVISAPPATLARPDVGIEGFRSILRFVRSTYDWTVIDLGRNLTRQTANLLDELDEIYLVATLEVPALHQTKQIIETFINAGGARERLHLIVNRLPKRSEITTDEVERMLGLQVYATVPNDYPSLYDAYAEGTLLSSESSLGRHFARVATRIAGIEPHKTKKKFALFF